MFTIISFILSIFYEIFEKGIKYVLRENKGQNNARVIMW